eukprot:4855264-Pyramimonas_sp.AAC.1
MGASSTPDSSNNSASKYEARRKSNSRGELQSIPVLWQRLARAAAAPRHRRSAPGSAARRSSRQ